MNQENNLEQKEKRTLKKDVYWDALQANKQKNEEKDIWIVENYNTISRSFSERFSALAGIALGLLPLILKDLQPQNIFEKHLICFSIIFLFFSIIAGSIDLLLSLKFWDKNKIFNQKKVKIFNKEIDNASKGRKTSEQAYLSSIKSWHREGKNPPKTKVPEIWIYLQVISVLLAFLSQTIFLSIRVFQF